MKKAKEQAAKQPDAAFALRALVLEERRSGRYSNLGTIVTMAKERGITVTWDALRDIGELGGGWLSIAPPFITDFIAAYATEHQPKSALDPCASIGSLLTPITRTLHVERSVGVTRAPFERDIAQLMSTDTGIEWVVGEPVATLEDLGEFDLVVSCPPIGLPQRLEILSPGTLGVSDSETNIIVGKAATHLSARGVGAFVVPDNFWRSKSAMSVRGALGDCGLHVNAVVAIPPRSFSSMAGLPLNIVLVSRSPTPDLFVGQLTPGVDHTPLLKNLVQRKQGASPELGRLVHAEEFVSWHHLVTKEEEERLAARSGLQPILLRDFVTAVNLGKQVDDGGFENLPNCVYLPLIGTSPAVASTSDLCIKPHNYAQLVVRPEVAHAEFLAAFFNTPLGRKTRDAMLSGTFIPKLSKQTILAGKAYLVPLVAQQDAMGVAREIKDLRLRLEQLERDLWNRPIDAAAMRKAMSALNQTDSFESWLETLPFPLASILWRYQAAVSADHKVTHLLNFFEAVAQYLGTLMASAFHSDAAFFRERRHDWFEHGKDNPHSLVRSSFGQWVVRCQRLAKTTRQLLSDKDHRDLVLDLYRTDAAKVEGLANKNVYAVLEMVGQYRNNWKGHTGIVSAKEHDQRLARLQEELTRLRASLGGVFEDWWLVRPGTSSYTKGVFTYSAEKVMGSRQIFKHATLTTTEVMDANELYCYDVVTQRPLQLLHFVRMLGAPETEEVACYFYNRLEKHGVRWVSYHFEKVAERVEPDAAVTKIIREVEEDNNQE